MRSPFSFFRHSSISTEAQKIRELKGLSLFRKLATRELRELEELLHERFYQTDEIIFDEGDEGLGLFIVVSGRVKVSSSHPALQHLAPQFGPGDFFGELALFRTEFFSLLERDRGIGVKILFELSRTVCRRSRNLVMHEQHLPLV
jgi:CRP/FNR family cyclic AMP-dependent transcriptional regulator